MRDLTNERTDTTALNYRVIKETEGDAREALKSTLCFDKGSPFIVDVKVVVLRVRVCLVVPPHGRDSSIGHHPVPPQAEGAPGAAACLQRWKLNERSGAQLQQQEDAGEGSDNGHAAEHGDGDGELGRQLTLRLSLTLSRHEVVGGLPHELVQVQAGAGQSVQGAVRGAGQAGLGAEAAAGQAGLRARQAGWDGSWSYGVPHRVAQGLLAHGEACRTFFDAALLKEVVARVALCNRGRATGQVENTEKRTGTERAEHRMEGNRPSTNFITAD